VIWHVRLNSQSTAVPSKKPHSVAVCCKGLSLKLRFFRVKARMVVEFYIHFLLTVAWSRVRVKVCNAFSSPMCRFLLLRVQCCPSAVLISPPATSEVLILIMGVITSFKSHECTCTLV
jgi:hypothetical protein